jgi:hypothetical protein
MSHFSSDDWLEFAREMVSSEQRAAMQRHLDDACNHCLVITETWRAVLEITRREIAYRPPESAVRVVKSAYLPRQLLSQATHIARMARVVFDSFFQPAPAGLRNAMSSSRQVIHEADPFVIDLIVDSDPKRKRVCLLGQVLNSKEPGKKVEKIEVLLLSGERLVEQTAANRSGEFIFEFSDEKDLRLLINIRAHRAIKIVLPGLET